MDDAAPRKPGRAWGEALMAQGDPTGAASRFQEGGKYAPRWGRLHMKWGQALAKMGRGPEAKAKYAAASGMDLRPDERAELSRVQSEAR